ncbi:hypothetical protein CNR22_18765 [Sphingobacteriaceae bacterium]|nr:hypothetical protein CNR22_18765 [Sphingobacteriaceae bacterium]
MAKGSVILVNKNYKFITKTKKQDLVFCELKSYTYILFNDYAVFETAFKNNQVSCSAQTSCAWK